MKSDFGFVFLVIVLLVVGLGWGGARIYHLNQFGRNCGDHLIRAADAASPEIAVKELDTALRYMETNGMTGGWTSIVYTSPDEDVGYWYRNTKQARDILKSLPP